MNIKVKFNFDMNNFDMNITLGINYINIIIISIYMNVKEEIKNMLKNGNITTENVTFNVPLNVNGSEMFGKSTFYKIPPFGDLFNPTLNKEDRDYYINMKAIINELNNFTVNDDKHDN